MNNSDFEHRLGYHFRDPALLTRALTHRSFLGEREQGRSRLAEARPEDYEQLEFLGDAFLDAVVSEWLLRERGAMTVGELSKARARIVCEQSLAGIACRLGISPLLRMSRGEDRTGGRSRPSMLADAVEGGTGAV